MTSIKDGGEAIHHLREGVGVLQKRADVVCRQTQDLPKVHVFLKKNMYDLVLGIKLQSNMLRLCTQTMCLTQKLSHKQKQLQ